MKTFREWMGKKINFREYAKPGDEVDADIVNYFKNTMPPKVSSYGYMQAGEPISSGYDKKGKRHDTYMTFEKESGTWIYRGCCFQGESEDMSGKR